MGENYAKLLCVSNDVEIATNVLKQLETWNAIELFSNVWYIPKDTILFTELFKFCEKEFEDSKFVISSVQTNGKFQDYIYDSNHRLPNGYNYELWQKYIS